MRLAIGPDASEDHAVDAVRVWIEANVPRAWVDAGREGGAAAVRSVRTRAEYEQWYPVFAGSGLVAPTWPVEYGGLDLPVALARRVEHVELRSDLLFVKPNPSDDWLTFRDVFSVNGRAVRDREERLTKLLTGLATLVAVEEGTVDLDEPAGPPGSTLRHLLAHASGLPPDDGPPLMAPGRRRIYSNAWTMRRLSAKRRARASSSRPSTG